MSSAPAKRRLHWMDMLRGAAIVMVLLWHGPAIQVLTHGEMPAAIKAVNMFFLPYRMPTLMILSGLLLGASLRKPLLVYWAGKVSMIVWPYLIWVTVDRFVEGSPHTWYHWRAWYATSYLWFLFFIGVYYVIAPLLRRLPLWVPVAAFALANLVLPFGTEKRLAYFAVFFFLGHWLGSSTGLTERLTSGKILWLWAPLAVVGGVFSSIYGLDLAYQIQYGVVSAAGVFVAIAVTRWIDEKGIKLSWLTRVGRNSIVYYCAHFPIMVGTIFLLHQLGLENFTLVSVINVAVALVACGLLVRLREYPPVTWLFAAPFPLTAWAKRATERLTAGKGPAAEQLGAGPQDALPATERDGS
ncbi:MAG: acyltransferase [Arachnia sp.]